ncbi:hypothetical protein [Paucihalobacter sp.]|uniref:hypothetical protein n=1 Tax=Paucihalobacter sp. TaxID=2850405 RepID=UPI002FE20C00
MINFFKKYIELIITAIIGLGFFFLGIFDALDHLVTKIVLFSLYAMLAIYVIINLMRSKHKKIAKTN